MNCVLDEDDLFGVVIYCYNFVNLVVSYMNASLTCVHIHYTDP